MENDTELMGESGLSDMTGSLFGDIPEGRCCMAIMGKVGDSKYMWSPHNREECEIAENVFNEYRRRGYLAFQVVGKDGDKGEQMTEFDPNAGRIIFVPPMAGG